MNECLRREQIYASICSYPKIISVKREFPTNPHGVSDPPVAVSERASEGASDESMILPAEIRLGADKRGKGRQEGRKERRNREGGGSKVRRYLTVKSATPGGRRAAAAAAAAYAMAADDGDAEAAVAAAKMDGRFIFNRLIQTGSIGGKPDRIAKSTPKRSKASRFRE